MNVLGILVDPIRLADTQRTIDAWVRDRRQRYVCVTPAHAVLDAYQDPELRRVFNGSGLTTPDGMAIVWLLRLRGSRKVERVYGPDLMLEVCRSGVEEQHRHFLLGGAPGVAEELGRRLEQRFPRIRIVGAWSPPFGPVSDLADREAVNRINAARPDIVWVGLGSPKQERWMAAHLGLIEAPVMIGVGAAFDFLAGRKPQAPRWMQRAGLEWLFRLATEPRRLWPRYRRYPLFVILVVAQSLGLRRFPTG